MLTAKNNKKKKSITLKSFNYLLCMLCSYFETPNRKRSMIQPLPPFPFFVFCFWSLFVCLFVFIKIWSVSAEKVESNANNSLKYVPGKARSHHLEKMMTKEELEEEQRVQHEQLAAIFQLLKENKETFGEVSEGDIEEQLQLYSI
uniref:Matrix-remodeling-associated protein 7 helical domain-containing protein n=1 Tax=Oreochromis niloticus TaxID=8128 RepID=A0A669EZT3_ORENI